MIGRKWRHARIFPGWTVIVIIIIRDTAGNLVIDVAKDIQCSAKVGVVGVIQERKDALRCMLTCGF